MVTWDKDYREGTPIEATSLKWYSIPPWYNSWIPRHTLALFVRHFVTPVKFNMLNTSTTYILHFHSLPYKHARLLSKESFKKGKKITTLGYSYTFKEILNTSSLLMCDISSSSFPRSQPADTIAILMWALATVCSKTLNAPSHAGCTLQVLLRLESSQGIFGWPYKDTLHKNSPDVFKFLGITKCPANNKFNKQILLVAYLK